MADIKKDVRLQIFITDTMDDKLSDMAEVMGLRKNELVRMALATYLSSWDQGVNFLRDYADKKLDGTFDVNKLMEMRKGK